MTDTQTKSRYADLIARLEQATEPSRELDAAIAVAARQLPDNSPEWLRNWGGSFGVIEGGRVAALHSDGRAGIHWEPPNFMGSFDAAFSLIPEGWLLYRINGYHNDLGQSLGFGAHLRPPNFIHEVGMAVGEHPLKLPPAICIAALKAIEAMEAE